MFVLSIHLSPLKITSFLLPFQPNLFQVSASTLGSSVSPQAYLPFQPTLILINTFLHLHIPPHHLCFLPLLSLSVHNQSGFMIVTQPTSVEQMRAQSASRFSVPCVWCVYDDAWDVGCCRLRRNPEQTGTWCSHPKKNCSPCNSLFSVFGTGNAPTSL